MLLEYDANLSLVANEINGNIKSTELKGVYGSYITLNGQTLDNIDGAELRYHSQGNLWIYAPNMTTRDGTSAKIEIAANAPFSYSTLPALTLFWNGSDAWQVANPNPTFSAEVNSWVNQGWFIAQFDTGAWTNGKVPTSYTGIKYNGNNITDLCSTIKFYLTNGLWFVYNASDAKLTALYNGYSHPTIEIEEGATVVYDGFTTTLPAMKFYYVNGAWQMTEPDGYFTHAVDFVSIQHNNVNYGTHCIDIGTTPVNGMYATLKFSEVFSAVADSTNYATNSYSIGTGLKINGVSIKDINGAFVDAAHGNDYMSVYVPFTALSEYKRATLTVDAGTEFRGKYLNSFTVYFKGSSWSTTANTKTAVNFSNIQWNNTGWDVFAGKSGVLLTYDAFLSTVSSDANQSGIAGVELKSYYGSYITLNGQTLNNIANAELRYYNQGHLWIYSPSMTVWVGHIPTIEIAANAPFLDAYLPALTIYYNSETCLWQFEEPELVIDIPDLGTPDCDFTGITLNNSNGVMSVFQFRSFVNIPTAGVEYTSTTGYYIRYNGTRLTEVSGAHVYTWENQCWLRIDIQHPTEGSVITIEEGTPFADNYLPKLIFKLIDGVWCKAFEVNITIDSDTYTVYSKDDIPVIINDEYFETLLAERSIPAKALGFSTRGVTYKAGTTFKALTDTDIDVIVIGFNTARGAAVRLKTPTGIRFDTYIDKADYDALVARVGSANIETGTYIMPRSFLETSDFRSYLADNSKTNGKDYVKIVNYGFANKETASSDGYYLYYGSLVNIQPNNYCTDFFGIGYIKITDGNNVYTVFGGYDLDEHTRTIYYVSGRSYSDFESDTPEKSALKSYLDGVVCVANDIEISNLIDIDGYVSPYTVTHNSQTGAYTVTGNAQIKSVMIGDKKRVNSRTNTLTVNGDTYYITDYSLTASAVSSTLTFKLSSVSNPLTLVDFKLEVPSDRGVKILQLTDTEIIDATQMRTSGALSQAQQEEYARKNIYANCFNYITELVENDRPDLIIITGDIVNGNFDDNGSMWLKIIEFMDSLDIPWAPVFGTLDNVSAKGAAWQRSQLLSAQNCLFKAGMVTGNGDYTIGITDDGVIRRVIYMLDSATNNGINSTQVNWVKTQAASVASVYGAVPGFICYNKDVATDFSSDFATANIDGVFKGNSYNDNSSTLSGGIYYTYGTKTGSYSTHNANKVGGTYVKVSANGQNFTITAQCLNKDNMKNKESIHLVETYDGSSVVTDAYLAPIWDTDRIYDETGLFVGETGSVTLMYTPTNPSEVVVRNITLGVTYTYGIDYTISGNKVTRVVGGNLPYMSYDEYYRSTPVYTNGTPQGFTVTPDGNGKAEDGYTIVGTKYLFFSEGFGGFKDYVTFTYNKTQEWTGTNITGDTKAQDFIDKLKDDKEATIFFYGDSITVGCNASGTEYGDYRNPNLPAWNDLVTDYLANLYGANITKYNGARGGWQTFEGAENFASKVAECGTTLASIDLLVLAYGINDVDKSESNYIANIESMIDAYLAANPSGSVLLVSPMKPNSQSSLVAGNGEGCESALNTIKNKAKYSSSNIALAKVFTMFNELVTVSGKLTRDYLGNNINHPNDFGVRLYAQVILKTLCGDDFN
ncbi:MAG: metallophosphoesterase [Clostridia bacterium]|nr:metallophosphoesterase [Clostridia bacterium]